MDGKGLVYKALGYVDDMLYEQMPRVIEIRFKNYSHPTYQNWIYTPVSKFWRVKILIIPENNFHHITIGFRDYIS